MATLKQIQQPIADELKAFDEFVAEQFHSDNHLMERLIADALSSRGKGVRPMLVLLSAALCSASGAVTRRAHIAAMMVEMIHLASLIHDDVIDEAPLRRDKPTLNALWQSKRAVLTGDYILARNMSIGLSSGQFDLVTHVVGAIATLCEGEVIQDDCARRVAMSREEYLSIIAKKTASLMAVSTSVGAKAAGAKPREVELMRQFGHSVGMAFQMQDDILDYTPRANSGKESYQDLREGKITLPLLIVLEQEADQAERERIIELVKSVNQSSDAVDSIIKFIGDNRGVEQAQEVMEAYITRAVAVLSEFPDSPYRSALINLCSFITERDR